jgi:hypothetical protein
MNRRLAPLLGAVALLAIASCGVPTQTSPTRLADYNVHVVGPVPSTTRAPGRPTVRAELCFVSGDRLVAIERELRAPLSARRVVDALVDLTRTRLPAGIRSAISTRDIAAASNALPARGIARVELTADFAQHAAAEQVVAVAQVVCTLTNLPGVGQVQFTHDGDPADIPRADGSRTSEPVSRFDYSVLLPTS